jgi:hypothetical protein
VRVVFFAALIMLLAWGLAIVFREPAPPPSPPSPAAVHHQLKDCRDLCEQTGIVDQLPEWRVRACWSSCEERYPPPPREPIRRITVAPADHSRTIRDVK